MTSATTSASTWQQLSFGADFSDVDSFRHVVSPDSQWVVYAHNPDLEHVLQLYSVPFDGSAPPQRISGLLGPSGLGSFVITPDSAHVIYSARQDDAERADLYRVPIGGGTPSNLTADIANNASVRSFKLSPDGSHIAYLAFDTTESLQIITTLGGTPIVLASSIEVDFLYFTELFYFTPAGDRVVYSGLANIGYHALMSVPTSGGESTFLAETSDQFLFPSDGDIKISPDGSQVVYRQIVEFDSSHLFSVPTTGGTPVSLTTPFSGNMSSFQITPDGSRVIHLALGHQAPSVWGIYTTPIGGGPIDLVLDLGVVDYFPVFQLSPDGSRVVVMTDDGSSQVYEMYSVPSLGGTPVKLNPTMPSSSDGVTDFKITADSQSVVYRADQLLPGAPMLWRSPIAGPAAANQSAFFGSPFEFPIESAWRLDPRSDRLVVLSNLFFVDGVRRPWRAMFDAGETELVDETEFVSGGGAIDFKFAPNGDIVYRADQNIDEKFELFSVTFGDEVFANGFESGDLSAWDLVVGQ